MKCSLGISNFLQEICSFPHSIVFLYFFPLFTLKGFLKKGPFSLDVGLIQEPCLAQALGMETYQWWAHLALLWDGVRLLISFKKVSLIKDVLAVGTPGGAELWHPSFLPGEGWHSLRWNSLPPALHLSHWSSVIFLTSALSPWLFLWL